jgi:rubrerythrin
MIKTEPMASTVVVPSRRQFLGGVGKMTLSATAIALIVGREALAVEKGKTRAANPSRDVGILNVALGLEHEAIGAYQIGAESGLLEKPVLDVAILFQSQHKAHRDALIKAVQQLGGTPVDPKSLKEYSAALNVAALKNQKDVLTLAAHLERGAANAYLGVIPSFADPALAQVAGRLAADETMHWTVLAQVLGQPLPTAALSFGA